MVRSEIIIHIKAVKIEEHLNLKVPPAVLSFQKSISYRLIGTRICQYKKVSAY